MDNVSLELDGVLYYKIYDPYKASYGVENPHFAISQLAQTTMRAQIGMLSLDRTLAERNLLNIKIVGSINEAAAAWGIECLRYEVRDIHLPSTVLQSMHSQVAAERSKRAAILESEGKRQAEINLAQGKKESIILASEAELTEKINQARGEAEKIKLEAAASAESIKMVSEAISQNKAGHDAVTLKVANKWLGSWSEVAKNSGSVVVVNAPVGDPVAMVTQGMAVFNTLAQAKNKV